MTKAVLWIIIYFIRRVITKTSPAPKWGMVPPSERLQIHKKLNIRVEPSFALEATVGRPFKTACRPKQDPDIFIGVGFFYFNLNMNITLKGPRLKLRPLKNTEASFLFKWHKDKEIIRFVDWSLFKPNLNAWREYIKKTAVDKNKIRLAMENEEGKIIGTAGLNLDKLNKTASLVVIIGEKTEWGKGYGGECIEILGHYVFHKLKYHRFELFVSMGSKRAVELYQRKGFVSEGIKRESEWNPFTKKFGDVGIMSILNKEWFKKYN